MPCPIERILRFELTSAYTAVNCKDDGGLIIYPVHAMALIERQEVEDGDLAMGAVWRSIEPMSFPEIGGSMDTLRDDDNFLGVVLQRDLDDEDTCREALAPFRALAKERVARKNRLAAPDVERST